MNPEGLPFALCIVALTKMSITPTPLAHLPLEHRRLVVRGAEEESVTEIEWIERAIVLRAGEQGVTAHRGEKHDAARHRVRAAGAHDEAILEGVSAEHRELVSAGAEQESVTAKEWIERAVALKAGHAPMRRHEAREHARPASHAAEEVRREEVRRESEEVDARRAAHHAPHPRHEETRSERGFSSYHSHVAARAAAAEAMPLDIWMEEAILERAGYRGREAARPAAPPAPSPPPPPLLPPTPHPPPPAPAVWETVVAGGGGRGGLVIGILLGVLLAIVLILFLSWIRSGGAIAAGGGSSGGVAMASVSIPAAYGWTYPNPPVTPPAPPGPSPTPEPRDSNHTTTHSDHTETDTNRAVTDGDHVSAPAARPEVVVNVIERDRVTVRSPTRRAPGRRYGDRPRYGYAYDNGGGQQSSDYDWRNDERRAWPSGCGCDANSGPADDGSGDPR